MASKADLQETLEQLEMEIQEAKRRLGAHSVKPVLMAALLDLEDRRDAILEQLRDNAERPSAQEAD